MRSETRVAGAKFAFRSWVLIWSSWTKDVLDVAYFLPSSAKKRTIQFSNRFLPIQSHSIGFGYRFNGAVMGLYRFSVWVRLVSDAPGTKLTSRGQPLLGQQFTPLTRRMRIKAYQPGAKFVFDWPE